LLYLVANQLFNAGAQIVAVLETTRFRDYIAAAPYAFGALKANEYLTKGSQMIQNLKRKGLRVQPATSNIYAAGNDKFEKVCFTANREYQEIEAKTLLLHQGVVPNVQITRQVGAMHEWYEPQRYWRPVIDEWGATTVKTLAVAGDGVGIFGAEVAEATGRLAGLDAAHRLGKIDELERDVRAGPLLRERNRIAGVRPLLDRLFRPTEDILRPTDDTLVCRCEEVTAGAIRECVADGATGPNQLKAYTRCGMGLCQGRICGLTVAEIIADASKKPIEDIGYYRLRPPLKPVTLGELAAMED